MGLSWTWFLLFLLRTRWQCHSPGNGPGSSPRRPGAIPGQFMRDLWWTMWYGCRPSSTSAFHSSPLIRARIRFSYPRRCLILRTDSVGEFSVRLRRPTSQGVISQKSGNPYTPPLDGKKKKTRIWQRRCIGCAKVSWCSYQQKGRTDDNMTGNSPSKRSGKSYTICQKPDVEHFIWSVNV